MSPRSLLFSSDQETSRQMVQILNEWEFGVESCKEIFEALKTLTSRTFQLLIVDWEEGLEASFLLKTARESRANKNAFVIVIGKAGAKAALEQAGADLIIDKPMQLDRLRHTLLTSDALVSRLKTVVPHFEALCVARQVVTHPAVPLIAAPAVAPQKPQPVARQIVSSPVRPHANKAAVSPAFATLENGFLQESVFQRVFQPRLFKGSVFLSAGMALAFFAIGYFFSQPLTQAGAYVAKATFGVPLQDRHQPAPEDSQLAAVKTPVKTRNSAKVRVTPLRGKQSQNERPVAASLEQVLPNSSETTVAATRNVQVPESIGSPYPGIASGKEVSPRSGPGLMASIEPVNIPGSLSDKLIVDKVDPSYPVKALQAGIHGPVVLQAWIGKDGRIRDLKLIRGPLLLGQAAFETVKNWRYKPYLLNGQAVEAQTLVTVDFKLP